MLVIFFSGRKERFVVPRFIFVRTFFLPNFIAFLTLLRKRMLCETPFLLRKSTSNPMVQGAIKNKIKKPSQMKRRLGGAPKPTVQKQSAKDRARSSLLKNLAKGVNRHMEGDLARRLPHNDRNRLKIITPSDPSAKRKGNDWMSGTRKKTKQKKK